MKRLLPKKWFLLASLLVLQVLFGTILGNIKASQAYAAANGPNPLLVIGQNCQNIPYDTGMDKKNLVNNSASCNDLDNIVAGQGITIGEMGQPFGVDTSCSNKMFYTFDPTSNQFNVHVSSAKWYIDEKAFQDCYKSASGALSDLQQSCQTVIQDQGNWNHCQDLQNQLVDILGCYTHMFVQPNPNDPHNNLNQNGVDACKNRLAAVGDLQLLIIQNGAATKDPNPIKSTSATNPGGGGGGADDPTSACENNSFTSLEWLFCPLITSLGSGANAINGFVENQLNFDASNDGQSFLPDSGANAGAHQAWNIIKDIMSSVLIILLLVMVISQAIGAGVFEAYTIKKVLPKLVIAVIAMQLSWDVCKFIINFVDHIGIGLAQIMAAPFGGTKALNLENLLQHMHGISLVGTGILLNIALVSTVALAGFFLPGIMLIAFAVLVAVVVGLATILFRNILIVACVIFSPVALVLWVWPGQGAQRYWKLWSENFTKALILFPLIVGLLYSGRIFAYIAGGTNQGANLGFLNLVFVLVGFFGVYAILPKAFKWGGAWMGAASGAISKGTSTVGSPLKKTLDNMQGRSRWTQARAARKAELDRRAKGAFYGGLAGGGYRGGVNRAMLGGIGRRGAEREIRTAVAEQATEQQRLEDYKVESARLSQRLAGVSETERQQSVRRIISEGRGHPEREAAVHAALKQSLVDRDYETVESFVNDAYASGNSERMAAAKRFVDTNAGDMLERVPHIVKGEIDPATGRHRGIERVARSSQGEVAKLHGEAVQSILSHLSGRAATGDADARRDLDQFLSTYAAATKNEAVKGSINTGGSNVVRLFLDNSGSPRTASARADMAADRQRAANAYDTSADHIEIQPDPGVRTTYASLSRPDLDDLRANIGEGGTIL